MADRPVSSRHPSTGAGHRAALGAGRGPAVSPPSDDVSHGAADTEPPLPTVAPGSVVLVFDLMDTLVTDPYREAHEAGTGMSFLSFEQRRPGGVYHALERADISELAYWEALRAAGIEIDPERFHAARRTGYAWKPGMRRILEQATALHRVLIATNYPAGWIDDIQHRFLSRFRLEVCASCRLGVRKPSRRFYEAMAERFGLRPGTTILIDDSSDNVAGALAAGWLAVQFRSAHETGTALKEFGMLLGDAAATDHELGGWQPAR